MESQVLSILLSVAVFLIMENSKGTFCARASIKSKRRYWPRDHAGHGAQLQVKMVVQEGKASQKGFQYIVKSFLNKTFKSQEG